MHEDLLSFLDGKEEDPFKAAFYWEQASGIRPMSSVPKVVSEPLPVIHPERDETSVGEMAATQSMFTGR